MICYVCKKEIKSTQTFYAIGKDKEGIEMYRHIKCNPGLPKPIKDKNLNK